ncbi:MAG: SIMPL domain-containing protein [Patescibacteria group bacterium]
MEPRSVFDDLFNSSAVRISLVGVFAILALFLFAKTMDIVQDFGRTDLSNIATISITGTGKASVAPNVAQISFSVEERATTVAAAQDSATKRTNDTLAGLTKLGILDKDIKTSGYNVNPMYATPSCPPGTFCPAQNGKITGYTVTQSIEVKVRDTAKTGEVLQLLGTEGVQNVSGPNFMVDDTSLVDAEARGKAIDDAHQKGEVLARQLGVHLGKVVGFSENGSSMPYPMFAGGLTKTATADRESVAPSVPTGENETVSNVTIVYEIR